MLNQTRVLGLTKKKSRVFGLKISNIIFDSRFSEKKRVDNGVDRENEQEDIENKCD